MRRISFLDAVECTFAHVGNINGVLEQAGRRIPIPIVHPRAPSGPTPIRACQSWRRPQSLARAALHVLPCTCCMDVRSSRARRRHARRRRARTTLARRARGAESPRRRGRRAPPDRPAARTTSSPQNRAGATPVMAAPDKCATSKSTSTSGTPQGERAGLLYAKYARPAPIAAAHTALLPSRRWRCCGPRATTRAASPTATCNGGRPGGR